MRWIRSLLLCLSTALAGAAPCVAQDSLEDLLGSMRTALTGTEAGPPRTGALFKGKGRFFGGDGTYQLLFQPPGRFLLEQQAQLSSKIVLDGESGFDVDEAGSIWPLELSDLERAKLLFWVQSGRWLDADAPVEIRFLEPADAREDAYVLGLRVKGGAIESRVEVLRSSFLPGRLNVPDPVGEWSLEFEQWQEGPGSLWPARVVRRDPSGTQTSWTVESYGPPPQYFADPFALNSARATGARFDDRVPAAIEAKLAPTGHVLVHPRIGGEDVGWFVLDSGAGASCLDKTRVGKLGLTRFGERGVTGAGGISRSAYVRARSLELGPMTLKEPLFIELDLSMISVAMKTEIAGVIGSNVFARAVIELDQATGAVAVHDPDKYTLAAGAAWQKVRFDRRHVCVEGRFEGDRSGVFRLDTGSAAALLFHAPAVERLGLLEGRTTTPTVNGGVGGMQQARAGTVAWFEIAGRRFENVEAQFSLAKSGALADAYTLGLVGVGILREFRLVFDDPHRRIAFVKRADK